MKDKRKEFAIRFGDSPFHTEATTPPLAVALIIPVAFLLILALMAMEPGTLGILAAGAGPIASISQDDYEKLDKMMKEYSDTFEEKRKAMEANNDIKSKELMVKLEKIDQDLESKFKDLQQKQVESSDRLSDLEQKNAGGPSMPIDANGERDIGEIVVESDQYKQMIATGAKSSGQIPVGSFFPRKGAVIINAQGQNQPLVQSMRVPGIIAPATRRLTIRDLIPSGPTGSNLVEFVRENVFTDSATPQYEASPGGTDQVENVLKAESNITFTLASEAVQTIAHWIRTSKQVLADAGMLQSYVSGRMMFGLQQEEEDQLLLGDNTAANLNGLVTQATAYDTSLDVANDTAIDQLRHAILQVALSEYVASGIVLHPTQWHTIELVKVNPGTDDRYVWANPAQATTPMIWGLPVVPTTAMTAGDFLVGAFALAAQIWDRENATIELSREDRDNFVRNMVTILAEERIALTVYRTAALVTGTFT